MAGSLTPLAVGDLGGDPWQCLNDLARCSLLMQETRRVHKKNYSLYTNTTSEPVLPSCTSYEVALIPAARGGSVGQTSSNETACKPQSFTSIQEAHILTDISSYPTVGFVFSSGWVLEAGSPHVPPSHHEVQPENPSPVFWPHRVAQRKFYPKPLYTSNLLNISQPRASVVDDGNKVMDCCGPPVKLTEIL